MVNRIIIKSKIYHNTKKIQALWVTVVQKKDLKSHLISSKYITEWFFNVSVAPRGTIYWRENAQGSRTYACQTLKHAFGPRRMVRMQFPLATNDDNELPRVLTGSLLLACTVFSRISALKLLPPLLHTAEDWRRLILGIPQGGAIYREMCYGSWEKQLQLKSVLTD